MKEGLNATFNNISVISWRSNYERKVTINNSTNMNRTKNHLLSQMKKTMTYDVGKLWPGLGQAQKGSSIKLVNETATLLSPVNGTATLLSPVNETATLLSPVNETAILLSPVNETTTLLCY